MKLARWLSHWSIRHGIHLAIQLGMDGMRGLLAPALNGGLRTGPGLRVCKGALITCRRLYLGSHVCLGRYSALVGAGTIRIGSGSVLNPYCTIDAAEEIEIGERVLIGPNTYIVDSNHEAAQPGGILASARTRVKSVKIGDDVWIGQGAAILAGTTIGQGAVVGAHAVVTTDVAPYETVVGIPARSIRRVGKAR